MAYGNYGAFVYRNGERMESHEDQTPYKENTVEPGYHQAFSRDERIRPHHAVLGEKEIRLCGHKTFPVLYVKGEKWDIDDYTVEISGEEYKGEINGYKFWAIEREDVLDLELIEPDGTEWEAKSGYLYGAGHTEEWWKE